MAMVSLLSCYDRARQHASKGEYAQAEGICEHVLQYYPQDLGTFQLLGQINLEQKRAREARAHFRRVLEIDPENVSAHWGMGIAYQDEGQLENAIAEFEQALEIKPDLTDLRNQLLRTYTELYGASRAQLRLSRAGLGRLYVKGEMYDKAIEEFREVLKVDPDRLDVQLSLLEVLWQRGQNDEAKDVCEAVLARLPHALKANLILGALSIAAGRQEEGEQLWREAAACDPNNTMARAIFDMAPTRITQSFLPYDAATLPEFDEAAWQARLEAAAAAPPEPAVPPPVEEAPAPAPVAAAVEPSGVSWLDSLATGEGRVEEEVGEEMLPGLAPFSLEGLGEAAGPPAEEFALEGLGEAPGPELPAPELAELGVGPEPQAADLLAGLGEPAAGQEPLADLGLGEEAFAAAPAAPQEKPAGPPARPEDQTMQPFRLEDLGLSPEEIASLEQAVSAARHEATAGAFPEPAGAEAGPPEEELLPGLAPFSLEEAPAAVEEEPALPGLAPFALEEVGAAAAVPAEGELPQVEPFSLEDFGLEAIGGEPVAAEVGGELQPFSLEDLGLDEPMAGAEAVSLDEVGLDVGGEVETGLPAFSWQEPGSRAVPAFRGELAPKEEAEPGGPSLFEKMMASRREAVGGEEAEARVAAEAGLPPTEEEVGLEGLPPFSLEGAEVKEAPAEAAEELLAEGVAPFVVEELELELAGAAAPAAEAPGPPPPFSLEELGLEETIAPAAGEVSLEGVRPFSLEEMGLEGPTPAAVEEMGAEALRPFSLEELGLEEPGAAAAPAAAPAVGLPEVVPFSLEGIGLEVPATAGEEAPAVAAAPPEEEVKPFTLEELGLTPEEIASLGLSEEEMAAMAAPEAPAAKAVPPAVEEVLPPAVEEMALPAVEELVPPPVEEVAAAVVEEVLPAAPVEEVAVEAVAVAPAGPSLEELRRQHAARPDDEELLLALAGASAAQGQFEEAVGHYKGLLKTGRAGLEERIVAAVQEWIGQEQEPARLQKLHRLLGDAYMKKGMYQQAISEYAWVLSKK